MLGGSLDSLHSGSRIHSTASLRSESASSASSALTVVDYDRGRTSLRVAGSSSNHSNHSVHLSSSVVALASVRPVGTSAASSSAVAAVAAAWLSARPYLLDAMAAFLGRAAHLWPSFDAESGGGSAGADADASALPASKPAFKSAVSGSATVTATASGNATDPQTPHDPAWLHVEFSLRIMQLLSGVLSFISSSSSSSEPAVSYAPLAQHTGLLTTMLQWARRCPPSARASALESHWARHSERVLELLRRNAYAHKVAAQVRARAERQEKERQQRLAREEAEAAARRANDPDASALVITTATTALLRGDSHAAAAAASAGASSPVASIASPLPHFPYEPLCTAQRPCPTTIALGFGRGLVAYPQLRALQIIKSYASCKSVAAGGRPGAGGQSAAEQMAAMQRRAAEAARRGGGGGFGGFGGGGDAGGNSNGGIGGVKHAGEVVLVSDVPIPESLPEFYFEGMHLYFFPFVSLSLHFKSVVFHGSSLEFPGISH